MHIHCNYRYRFTLLACVVAVGCSSNDNPSTNSLQSSGGTGPSTTLTGGQLSIVGGAPGGGARPTGSSGAGTGGAPSGTGGAVLSGGAGNGGTGGVVAAAGAIATSNAGSAGAATTERLSQTGLFESDMKTLRADVIPFTPRFELWSDAATKRRWIYLPPGTTIDTSDPDYWKLPVGTKVWKEFSKNGKRIETRLVERVSSRNYRMIAYLWAEDLSDAIAVPNGMLAALGTDHDVPNATDCETCHNNHPGRFIGVSAIQLDYDYAGLTVAKLQAAGRLSQPVPSAARLPGDATAQAALGILHVNCGTCHNPNSTLPYKALDLWQRVGMMSDVTATPFYVSTVGVASGTNPDVTGPATIVVPGHPEQSALIYRMGSRTSKIAMPPLGTKQVDSVAVDTVTKFIAGLK